MYQVYKHNKNNKLQIYAALMAILLIYPATFYGYATLCTYNYMEWSETKPIQTQAMDALACADFASTFATDGQTRNYNYSDFKYPNGSGLGSMSSACSGAYYITINKVCAAGNISLEVQVLCDPFGNPVNNPSYLGSCKTKIISNAETKPVVSTFPKWGGNSTKKFNPAKKCLKERCDDQKLNAVQIPR